MVDPEIEADDLTFLPRAEDPECLMTLFFPALKSLREISVGNPPPLSNLIALLSWSGSSFSPSLKKLEVSSELARVDPTPFCSASDLASAKSRSS